MRYILTGAGAPQILLVNARAMSGKDSSRATVDVDTTLPLTAFEVTLNHLNDLFNVTDGKAVRIGAQSNQPVSSFKGMDLETCLKVMKVYPSRLKICLITEEKFPDFSDESDEEEEAPKKKKKKEQKNRTPPQPPNKDAPPDLNELDGSEVTKGNEIGRGASAVVYKGKWRDMDVTVKVCSVPTAAMAKMLANVINSEIRIHMSISHHNVLTMFGFVRAHKEVSMVTELMALSLREVLSPEDKDESKTKLDDAEKKKEIEKAEKELKRFAGVPVIEDTLKAIAEPTVGR